MAQFIGIFAFQAAKRLFSAPSLGLTVKSRLHPRPRDCVILAGRGFSNKEIARALALTPRTVDGYLTEEEMFELAMTFMANPSNLWKSDRIEDKQTVIKLVFADRLRYSRFEGFRTPQFSKVFKTLEGTKSANCMMPRQGVELFV